MASERRADDERTVRKCATGSESDSTCASDCVEARATRGGRRGATEAEAEAEEAEAAAEEAEAAAEEEEEEEGAAERI